MREVWKAPHVIGGQDVWSGTALMQRCNPANKNEVVTEVGYADAIRVESAVKTAHASLNAWQKTPIRDRLAIIGRIAALLRENIDLIALAMVMEVGKTTAGAKGEVNKAASIADFYATFDPGWFEQVMPDKPGVRRSVRKIPRGVVAIITAFNFPIALADWKIIPALLAGCTVVYKPSELTPYVAYLLMKVFKDAGVPDGVVNLVHGDGSVAEQIIRHPHVKAVSFTGSSKVGNRVRRLAARYNKPACCEMGGLNAMMILADWGDRIPQFVKDVIAAAFSAAGQRCTATKRVLIEASIYDAVVEELVRQTGQLRVGPGIDDKTNVEPLVSAAQLERVLSAINAGKDAGMKVLFGGFELKGGINDGGHYLVPTILEGNPLNKKHRTLHEETFGPVVTLVKIDDFDHGLEVMNGVDYGHCGSLYTDLEDLIERFLVEAMVGMRHVREHTLGGDADMPFTGMKASMSGPPEMGVWGIDFFCQTVACYVNEGKVAMAATAR